MAYEAVCMVFIAFFGFADLPIFPTSALPVSMLQALRFPLQALSAMNYQLSQTS